MCVCELVGTERWFGRVVGSVLRYFRFEKISYVVGHSCLSKMKDRKELVR